jgi:uncharacterized protein YndB with AHSA1/START domain
MQLRSSILVARPPAEVFAFMADPAKAARWRTHLVSSKGASAAVGDRVVQTYSYEGKTSSVELVVSKYEPPEYLQYTAEKPVRAVFTFHCRPDGDGTRVSMTMAATVSGAAALFAGRIEREADQLLRSDLSRLKAVLESGG